METITLICSTGRKAKLSFLERNGKTWLNVDWGKDVVPSSQEMEEAVREMASLHLKEVPAGVRFF
jgi:hypothetical protein